MWTQENATYYCVWYRLYVHITSGKFLWTFNKLYTWPKYVDWWLNFCYRLFTIFWYVVLKKCFLKPEKNVKYAFSNTASANTQNTLHVLDTPFVCHVFYSFLLRQFREIKFLKSVWSVNTIPPVTRSDTESIGRWFWASVSRFTCKQA